MSKLVQYRQICLKSRTVGEKLRCHYYRRRSWDVVEGGAGEMVTACVEDVIRFIQSEFGREQARPAPRRPRVCPDSETFESHTVAHERDGTE